MVIMPEDPPARRNPRRLTRRQLADTLFAMDRDSFEDGEQRGTLSVCLGPPRCDCEQLSCEWCLHLPAHAGYGYLDTFLAIHRTGH